MSTHDSPLDRLRTTVGPRLPATPAVAGVFLGDLLALAALFVAGLYRHGVDPVSRPLYALESFAPFAIGWVLLAPLCGLYLRETLESYPRTLGTLVAGWVSAVALGGLLRSTAYFHGDASLVFLLVQVAFGLLLLTPWRLAVTAVTLSAVRHSR